MRSVSRCNGTHGPGRCSTGAGATQLCCMLQRSTLQAKQRSLELKRCHVASAEHHSSSELAREFDPLRDGPLRFLGYTNELGEAFRPLVPSPLVWASYGVALMYVAVDTADKYRRAADEAPPRPALDPTSGPILEGASKAIPVPPADPSEARRRTAALTAVDTVIWQLLASVTIPGYLIHQTVHAVGQWAAAGTGAHLLLRIADVAVGLIPGSISAAAASQLLTKALPTATGLLLIPLIAPGIDHAVEALLDMTLRKWTGLKK